MPDVRTHGAHTHGVTLGGFSYDPLSGRVVLVSVIDNLLKGAATQVRGMVQIGAYIDSFFGAATQVRLILHIGAY